MFTRPDGQPINPNYATTRFRKLVERTELPPVRLHDLRHGAASLAHQAGADLKTLQDLLGHSSIVITADTYTTVLPQVQRHYADATAHLVLTAARRTRQGPKEEPPQPAQAPTGGTYSGSEDTREAAGHEPATGRTATQRDDTRMAPT